MAPTSTLVALTVLGFRSLRVPLMTLIANRPPAVSVNAPDTMAPVLVALDPLSTMMVFMPPPMAMTFDSMIPPAADRVSLPVPK